MSSMLQFGHSVAAVDDPGYQATVTPPGNVASIRPQRRRRG